MILRIYLFCLGGVGHAGWVQLRMNLVAPYGQHDLVVELGFMLDLNFKI